MCSGRCLCRRRRRCYSCSRRLYVVRRLTVQSEATVATAFTIARRRDGWRAAHMAAAAARLHSQKQRFIRRRRSHHCPLLTVAVAVVGLVKRSCSKPHCAAAAAAPRAAAVARALKRMNEGLCTILSLEPAAHFLRSQQHSSQRTGGLGRFHVCTAFASSCRFHSLASLLHAHVNSYVYM